MALSNAAVFALTLALGFLGQQVSERGKVTQGRVGCASHCGCEWMLKSKKVTVRRRIHFKIKHRSLLFSLSFMDITQMPLSTSYQGTIP